MRAYWGGGELVELSCSRCGIDMNLEGVCSDHGVTGCLNMASVLLCFGRFLELRGNKTPRSSVVGGHALWARNGGTHHE